MRAKATKLIFISLTIIYSITYANQVIAGQKYYNGFKLSKIQEFHKGNGEEPESLDPHKSTGVPASDIQVDLYEGLMTYDQQGNLILGQAESYNISQDLKTYTFKLRDKLKWSNGDKLSSCDFVAGMRRTVDPKVGSIYSDILKPVKNAEKIIDAELDINNLGVTCPDDKTVIIQLAQPTPYFLETLTHSTTYPIHVASLKKYGDKFTKPGKLISNGPFKLDDWVVNSHIKLVKNKYYRDADQVVLNSVYFYPTVEASTELKRYRADDLDFTKIIPDVQFNWIKKNLDKELYIAPHLATYYYGFNLEQPPFKDNVNLRKAVSLAIDKNVIAQKVLRSGQIPTDNLVPAGVNNYLKDDSNTIDLLSYTDRIKLAKEYYAKSGYSKNNPAKIKITYNTQEAHKNIAVAIAAMLKKNLGIETELFNQEWKVFIKTRQERKDTQLFREGWVGDYNDPATFLDLYVSDNPQNHGGYKNPDYDKLMQQASKEPDLSKRARLMKQAEKLLLDDAAIIPLYTYVSRHLVKSKVGGFDTNLMDKVYDRYIYIKET